MTISTPVNSNATLKLIVMQFGQLTVACRIDAVYKVIKQAHIHSSGLGATGLTHLDGRNVVVVDLYHRLFNQSVNYAHGYLVILQVRSQELVAIQVNQSPNLMDVQRDYIKVLPDSYRQSDTLGIANQVAVIPDGDNPLTIFVLDENALI